MQQAYEDGDMERIARYCLVDARLPLQILEHENMISLLFQLASLSGASLQQAFNMTNSSLVVASLARITRERKIVNNLPRADVHAGRFQGACVFEPTRGIHPVLAIMDFAALYPSIIIGYNMCYTTIINRPDESTTTVNLPGGRQVHFTNKRVGLLPATLKHFLAERATVKQHMKTYPKGSDKYKILDSKQQGIKTICNTFYGFLGSVMPFAMRLIAECVTAVGRDAVQRTQSYIEQRGYKVVFGDTDSCGCVFPETMSEQSVEETCEKLARVISAEVFDNKLILEYEKQLRPCVIFKKKMYVGCDPRTGTLLIKGLAAKRRNFMPFVRESFKCVLELLCRGEIEQAFSYVEQRFSTLVSMSCVPWSEAHFPPLEDFAISSKVKHRSEYKGTPSLGYLVNQKLGAASLCAGSRISYVYYYDKSDRRHNGSKRSGHWSPGKTIDILLPVQIAQHRTNLVIDVYKVLDQHHKQLYMYFRGASYQYASRFERLYNEAISTVKKQRGCKVCKNYDILFLHL